MGLVFLPFSFDFVHEPVGQHQADQLAAGSAREREDAPQRIGMDDHLALQTPQAAITIDALSRPGNGDGAPEQGVCVCFSV